jgi:cyclophilin family peptidyl-prolyl cis-trans isomerase
MMQLLIRCCLLIALSPLAWAAQDTTKQPVVVLHTNHGDITLQLYPQRAPLTVANFLDYAKSGHYSQTLFHRVVKRFVIQGGGFDIDGNEKPTKAPIANESRTGLYNDRWTVAMARTSDPDSATSQFYINMRMNNSLDSQAGKPGYTVFGEVIDGFHVAQAINRIPTRDAGGSFTSLPVEPVILESVTVQ